MIGVGLIGNRLLDADLEKAARQRERAVEMAVAILFLLAHVEKHVLLSAVEPLLDLGRR